MVGHRLGMIARRRRNDAARSLFSVSCSSLLSAPRSLYAAVNCRFSNLSQTSAPMISDSVRLTSIGVRMTSPSIRSAAARMSSIVGGCIFEV